MSEQKKNTHPDYSKFDEMSTETLEEILRLDAQLPDDEESDMDAIIYIMEVIARREKENPTGRFPDVETSWKTFNEKYRPQTVRCRSLYEDEDSDKNFWAGLEPIPFTTVKPKPSQKRGRSLLKIASIAAVIVAIAFAGTITAHAFGFNLWGAVAQWSKETFGFIDQSDDSARRNASIQDSETFADLRAALSEHGINSPIIPTYIPKGFIQTDFYVYDIGNGTLFGAVYSDNSTAIVIEVCQHTDSGYGQYQKDDMNPEIYMSGGIEHYIMTNMNSYITVWQNGMLEGSIIGLETKDELIRMIDSIYGDLK